MRRAWLVGALLTVAAAPARAGDADPAADPLCWESQLDPVPTPLRDDALDGQVGGCLRDEASARVVSAAEIDTPGFYGRLAGGLELAGRHVVAPGVEVGGALRAVDALYVQNAVIKTTDVTYGPLTVHAALGRRVAAGRLAARLDLEVPGSRADAATTHLAAALAVVYSALVAPRLALHARASGLVAAASSAGGSTTRGLGRVGADLAWWARPSFAVIAGVELQAGWYHGFDDALLRLAVHGRLRGGWRAQLGVGAPVLGAERTTASVTLGVVRDLD